MGITDITHSTDFMTLLYLSDTVLTFAVILLLPLVDTV